MKKDIERDMGEQPFAEFMEKHELKSHDLVASSTEHITHKMVTKACKGRRLSPNVRQKVINALNKASGQEYTRKQLFTY